MITFKNLIDFSESLPARERGLKHNQIIIDLFYEVAPRAGAWIETHRANQSIHCRRVAPRAGAWIETDYIRVIKEKQPSLPARERGLKLSNKRYFVPGKGRSPRGSVD